MMIPVFLFLLFVSTEPPAEPETVPPSPTGSSILTLDTWWEADPFERSRFCEQMGNEVDVQTAREIILAPVSSTNIERVREYLQSRGAQLPPPNGAFFEPKVKLSRTEARRERTRKEPPSVMDLLLAVPYSRTEPSRNQLFSDMARRGCLIRGLGRLRELSVPPVFLDAAFYLGTLIFRDEITEALSEFGPLLVPTFLELSLENPNRERHPERFFRSRWARFILQGSTAGNPRLNLDSAATDLKKTLIELYAHHQVAEAINPILSLANDEDIEVREAAREALITYLSTGTSQARVGTVKAAGGQEAQAVLYITARSQAYHAIRRDLEEISRGDYDRTTKGVELAKQLFRFWDQARDRRHEVAFAQAMQMEKEGDLDGAVEAYRNVLAFSPNLPGKEKMAHAFLQKARRKLENKDISGALLHVRLYLQVQDNPHVEADLYYLLGLREEGAGDRQSALQMYRMALLRNPAHAHSAAAVYKLDPAPRNRVADDEQTAFLFALLAGILAFVFVRWPLTRV